MEGQNRNENFSGSIPQNTQVMKADVNLLFAGDSYGLFVYQKVERIVTAVYLLTGLMSDREPMKEKLRGLASEMLLTALEMSERVWGEDEFQKDLIAIGSEISAFFDVAEKANMLSKMNHGIMSAELKKFSDFLLTSASNYSSAKIAFEPNLFDGNWNYVPTERSFASAAPLFPPAASAPANFSQGQKDIKDNMKNNVLHQMSDKDQRSEKKIIKDKDNRQDIIRAMLKSGEKLTIKDFTKTIKDCSEKTIQRELVDMVAKGILKKEGERRWSKYFLA